MTTHNFMPSVRDCRRCAWRPIRVPVRRGLARKR